MAYCNNYETVPFSSWFSDVQQQPAMEEYMLEQQYKKDEYEYKLDLSFFYYNDEDQKPWVFPVVRTVEKVLAGDAALAKEYLHPFGYDSFCKAAVKILLGEDDPARIENRAFAIQTISACGALRIGAEFLVEILGKTVCYGADMQNRNTMEVFQKAGFKEFHQYRYFSDYTLSLNIEGMLKDLRAAQEGSVVFLQVCSHNPTGCDPTREQWQTIADLMFDKKLFPFFFCQYQGFVSGDMDEDVWPVRLFARRCLEFFCAQSFAKTFSLYSERVGALTVVINSSNKVNAIKSHLFSIISTMYATPPSHGARVVAFIMSDKTLLDELKDTIAFIAKRLKQLRTFLREELDRLGAPGTWMHITNQVGNFLLTGLNDMQVQHMRKHFHIYMLSSGRLTVSGLNLDNVEYVAWAINQTLQLIPPTYIRKHVFELERSL